MSARGTLLRFVNKAVAFSGFEIRKVELDFTHRLDSGPQLQRLHRDMATELAKYLKSQKVVNIDLSFDFETSVELFYDEYLKSPFRHDFGGSRYNNLLWLYVFAKAYRPTAIIDSGTYWGASAWALSLGASEIPIHSFDIDLSRLKLHAKGVTYHESDWTEFDHASLNLSRGLVYFDDHVDQAKRLIEASERRYPFAIFDDDFPVTAFAPFAHEGHALAKVEFVLDDDLRRQDEIAWISRGKRFVWKIDHPKLERARAVISATDRVANTSPITGVWQTPYRIVALR
jgi:hypothetical protein